ncbi:MAG: PleD family two-component system response regulator [Nitrospinota bacterium]
MAIVSERPVLVVDDEYHITHAVAGLLKMGGRTCIALNESRGVMDLIDKQHPRVIVLDVKMPDGDGLEICRAIRSEAKYDDLKVIMMTALGSDEDKERGFEAGADEYVLKPFHPIELQKKIDSYYL